jgi:hypothetical protein
MSRRSSRGEYSPVTSAKPEKKVDILCNFATDQPRQRLALYNSSCAAGLLLGSLISIT